MTDLLFIAFILLTIVNFIILFYLYSSNKKLTQDCAILSDAVERNNKDIAGLCLAAVSVDNKLLVNQEKLDGIAEQVADLPEYEEPTSQPYHTAIQKVRNGADAEELIEQCGLSKEEAILLIRLHGS